jgi:hypothetical protein
VSLQTDWCYCLGLRARTHIRPIHSNSMSTILRSMLRSCSDDDIQSQNSEGDDESHHQAHSDDVSLASFVNKLVCPLTTSDFASHLRVIGFLRSLTGL